MRKWIQIIVTNVNVTLKIIVNNNSIIIDQ